MKMCDKTYDDKIYKNIIAVSNRKLCVRPFLEQIERVCRCGPKGLILREKDLPEEDYEYVAGEVLEICNDTHVPCILHTYVDAARKLKHPYIHLPLPVLCQNAGTISDFKQVGCSVHSVEDALLAVKCGATYLTAGHIYETACKAGVTPRGLDFLRAVCSAVDVPVYAIGGIHPGQSQVNDVMRAGAAGACVMSDMMKI